MDFCWSCLTVFKSFPYGGNGLKALMLLFSEQVCLSVHLQCSDQQALSLLFFSPITPGVYTTL